MGSIFKSHCSGAAGSEEGFTSRSRGSKPGAEMRIFQAPSVTLGRE
jgi:hypothetical protein